MYSFPVTIRGASIRIPINTAKDWKGYLEDRRPASNGDPYKITWALLDTLVWENIHRASIQRRPEIKEEIDSWSNI